MSPAPSTPSEYPLRKPWRRRTRKRTCGLRFSASSDELLPGRRGTRKRTCVLRPVPPQSAPSGPPLSRRRRCTRKRTCDLCRLGPPEQPWLVCSWRLSDVQPTLPQRTRRPGGTSSRAGAEVAGGNGCGRCSACAHVIARVACGASWLCAFPPRVQELCRKCLCCKLAAAASLFGPRRGGEDKLCDKEGRSLRRTRLEPALIGWLFAAPFCSDER